MKSEFAAITFGVVFHDAPAGLSTSVINLVFAISLRVCCETCVRK